ncbi:MAG: FkbM family methyltransferase [Chthoniobacterales bacterium]
MALAEFVYTVLLKAPPLRNLTNRALKAIIPAQFSVHEARVCLNPNDPVVAGALTLRVYEREEIDFFRTHFQPGMTFLDIGANVGLYTALALSLKAATVMAVEPHAESRSFLERTAQLNAQHGANIFISPFAAAEEKKDLPLYENPDNKGDNRLYADALCITKGMVHADKVDSICAEKNIHTVQFVKIDTQGAEYGAIRGAAELLRNSPECIIMSEFWPYGLRACGSDPAQYLALLEELGFHLFELVGKNLIPVIHDNLIAKTSGRKYANIIGFKNKDGGTPSAILPA